MARIVGGGALRESDLRKTGRICLISPGLPSTNPRLVKEAEALVGAGFDVRCVVGDYETPYRQFDGQLLRDVGVPVTRVGLGRAWTYKSRRARQEAAMQLFRLFPGSERIAGWAASPQTRRLAAAAARTPADLYIGHNLPALPAAVWAARRHGSLAGFDAEDYHAGETGDSKRDALARRVERLFLGHCRHLSASSPLIAEAYRRDHGVEMIRILNVFPKTSDCDCPVRMRKHGAISLYWFSQTIGPGRGLEALIQGAGQCRATVRIALRGAVSSEYRSELERLAAQCRLKESIVFLPPAHPDDMIRLAAEHDVGLSIEITEPLNKRLALSNKLFTYLQAGVPQLMSRTPAQEWIADRFGEAAVLVELDDPRSIAAGIDSLAFDESRYQRAAREARRLADDCFCWEIERERLIEAVGRLIGLPTTGNAHASGAASLV